MTNINKSHQYAIDLFSEECLKQIGIKPLDDDKLVLSSSLNFGAYIKTFKRLDHTVNWHKDFIDKMVEAKINALSRRINITYGSHQKYIEFINKRNVRF